MQVRAVSHRGRTILVEWSDAGVPKRSVVPPEKLAGDQIDEYVLRRCPEDPDALRFEHKLRIFFEQKDMSRLLLALRRRGLWTGRDVIQKPGEVVAVQREVWGDRGRKILNAARESL